MTSWPRTHIFVIQGAKLHIIRDRVGIITRTRMYVSSGTQL